MKLPVNRGQVRDVAWRRYILDILPTSWITGRLARLIFLRAADISLFCALLSPRTQPSRASLRASCVYNFVDLNVLLLTSTLLIEQRASIPSDAML